jgi:transposase
MNQPISVSVGIDWADAKHDFHLITPDGQTHAGEFDQDPKAIADQIQAWRKLCPGAIFAVAIEASKGAIINALLEFDDLQIYPVNPAALANYRRAFAHGGGKNDPVDAKLLAQFIHHYCEQLQPLRPDSELTRKLAAMARDRRRLVDQRADLANELTALLKSYFPAALAMKPARSYSEFFLKFLQKYPSLAVAQTAGATRLRNFFHGIGAKRKAEEYVKTLLDAVPLTTDAATIEMSVLRVAAVIDQLQTLTKHVKRYEKQLKEHLPQHDGYQVVKSLPGAAVNTQARIIAALGDDRNRFPTAASLQAASGIAPVTSQSGRQKFVNARWACPKFEKQTFHEYAGLSISQSRWAKAYYEQQKEKNKTKRNGAQIAKRALAYKWQRIIHRLWISGEPYNEERYIARLQATGSPLFKLLSNTA